MVDISRRTFLKLGAIAGASAIVGPDPAFASNEENKIKFTADLARQFAEEFASSMQSERQLSAGTPVEFFDTDGLAIGYIVPFNEGGYVVFDSTEDSLVSQFSFSEDSASPYGAAISTGRNSRSFKSDPAQSPLIKVSPFAYCVLDTDNQIAASSFGASFNAESLCQSFNPSSVDPSNWDDIFIPFMSNPGNYSFGLSGTSPYLIAYSESHIKNSCGRYACAVSAMIHCAEWYCKAQATLPADYTNLWALSGTSVIGYDRQGRPLGSTTNSKIGAATRTHVMQKGGPTLSYSNMSNPSYSRFMQCIDRGDFGIFSCGINIEDGTTISAEGHAMTVEGYATMLDKSLNRTFETLLVANGWSTGPAYVNLDFAKYTYTYGIIFAQ